MFFFCHQLISWLALVVHNNIEPKLDYAQEDNVVQLGKLFV
jgi:hypothetical protein